MSFAAAFESYRDKEKRVEKWVELFLTAVPEQKRGVLLDCGCGVGRFSVPLASSFEMVIGIDIDETMLSIARKRTNDVQWIHGNICCTPLNNDSVDVVLASMLIEHLKSFRSFQKEIFRLIKPAGILLMRTMLPEDIAATTWYQFSETAYKMECSRTHDLAWIVQNMAEYGFVLERNNSVMNVKEYFYNTNIVEKLSSKCYEIIHHLEEKEYQRMLTNAKKWEMENHMPECMSTSLLVFAQEKKTND